ncbi:MAG: DUF1624 domain-containing protein, partial [Clostridiaceae bacterium]|nr:DUF1624 domain-containing protein [Clostridiaceae bacterium]
MESVLEEKKKRILEIDLLRGLAVFLMMLHHLIFDLRYIVGLDVFAFQETVWFQDYLRPPVIAVFIMVSGISSSFSRNNMRRGVRLLIASLILTGGSLLVRYLTSLDQGVVIFNVFHVLAISIIVNALLEKVFQRRKPAEAYRFKFFLLLTVLGTSLIFLPGILHRKFELNSTIMNIIFFAKYPPDIKLLDNMALFPWIGFFLIGAAFGLVLYRERSSLLPEPG